METQTQDAPTQEAPRTEPRPQTLPNAIVAHEVTLKDGTAETLYLRLGARQIRRFETATLASVDELLQSTILVTRVQDGLYACALDPKTAVNGESHRPRFLTVEGAIDFSERLPVEAFKPLRRAFLDAFWASFPEKKPEDSAGDDAAGGDGAEGKE